MLFLLNFMLSKLLNHDLQAFGENFFKAHYYLLSVLCWPLDNDDCLEDDTLCGPYGECLNVDGSFECDCPMGFVTTADRKACKGKVFKYFSIMHVFTNYK